MMSLEDALELAEHFQRYRSVTSRHLAKCLGEDDWKDLFWADGELQAEYDERAWVLMDSVGLTPQLFQMPGKNEADREAAGVASDTFLLSAIDEMNLAVGDVLDATEDAVATGNALLPLMARREALMAGGEDEAEWARLWEALHGLAPLYWRRVSAAILSASSFWDRAGQLINYVYFNVREFDRETFPTVMEKVSKNYARDESLLEAHTSWSALRTYWRDDRAGYGELLQRRNVLTHSIAMRASDIGAVRRTYTRTPNALERKRALRVPQDDPAIALDLVIRHVRFMVHGRVHVIGLCQFGIDSLGLRPQRFDRS